MANANTAKWVDVVDADGVAQPNQVPAHWVGTDLLPHGWKAASEASKDEKPTDPNPVPAKSTSRADLETYAVEHGGMTEEQAKGYPNADELHKALTAAKSS